MGEMRISPTTVLERSFAPLVARNPELAMSVARIMARAIDMALKSRQAHNPSVWIRALVAASSEFSSEKLAKQFAMLKKRRLH